MYRRWLVVGRHVDPVMTDRQGISRRYTCGEAAVKMSGYEHGQGLAKGG